MRSEPQRLLTCNFLPARIPIPATVAAGPGTARDPLQSSPAALTPVRAGGVSTTDPNGLEMLTLLTKEDDRMVCWLKAGRKLAPGRARRVPKGALCPQDSKVRFVIVDGMT